ncbi:MAG: hypothetical protein AB3N14_18635 [Flavobacteriaceae bacterium]
MKKLSPDEFEQTFKSYNTKAKAHGKVTEIIQTVTAVLALSSTMIAFDSDAQNIPDLLNTKGEYHHIHPDDEYSRDLQPSVITTPGEDIIESPVFARSRGINQKYIDNIVKNDLSLEK